jgi:hypothetical protein
MYIFITIMFLMKFCLIKSQGSLQPFEGNIYNISWSINQQSGFINFNINTTTKGWIGIGLSNNANMTNSDLSLCYMNRFSIPICVDGFNSDNKTFNFDTSEGGTSNIYHVQGEVVNGISRYRLSKPLQSSDTHDVNIKRGAKLNVMFAYREIGNPSTEDGMFKEETNKTVKEIILYKYANPSEVTGGPVSTVSEPSFTMTFGFDNIPLPRKDSYHVCKYFNVSQIASELTGMDPNTLYHATEFDPSPGNIRKLYQISIIGCPNPVNFTTDPFNCTGLMTAECNCPVLSWKPGNLPFRMPTEAGRIWGSDDTSIVMFHAHYANPRGKEEDTDTSNTTITFTPKLRKYDTGLMILGKATKDIIIPPGLSDYTIKAFCSNLCALQMTGDVKLFAFYVMGLDLTKAIVTTVRDQQDQDISFGEGEFDPRRPAVVTMNPMIALKPGFKSTTTCVYDSKNKTSAIVGGYSWDDELCFNVIYYYPKENGVARCVDGENECVLGEKTKRTVIGN